MVEAQEMLQQSGLLTKTAGSNVIHANPLLNVLGVLRDRVNRGLREFGCTASSRSRIITSDGPGGGAQDELEAILNRPRSAAS